MQNNVLFNDMGLLLAVGALANRRRDRFLRLRFDCPDRTLLSRSPALRIVCGSTIPLTSSYHFVTEQGTRSRAHD